jgi:hypothetical protein
MAAQQHGSSWLELETTGGKRIKVLAQEHPRARHLSLTFGVHGPRVSAPRGTHPSAVRAFLRENTEWLERKLKQLARQGLRLSPPSIGARDTLLWRGSAIPVRWEYSVFPRVRLDDEMVAATVTVGLDLEHREAPLIAQRALRGFVVAQMKREVARLTRLYEPMVGKSIVATRLLPLKTLWGSLSVNARMTLDLSLMMAPPAALEYVVAHEMSHLWVRNHGRLFWERVEAIYPEYREQRQWLSRHGHAVKAELARWIGSALP